MAFRMRPEQALETEARRIGDKQLRLAIAALGAARGPGGKRRIHTARRHVKKVRALIRLVDPRLQSGGHRSQQRLRKASRMLAGIADSEALITTLGVLSRRYPGAMPAATEAELRDALLAREAQVRRLAEFTGALRKVAAQLASERAQVATWQFDGSGLNTVAPGLRRSVRREQRAMHRALVRPTTRRYSAWRRRVKDLWFQMRLIEGYTGSRLIEGQKQLERLDGLLGEAHNCALLCDALVAGAFLSRAETAGCLRLIRRYRADLRREAHAIAPLVHGATPQDLVRRITHAWRAPEVAGERPQATTRCPAA